MNKQAIDGLKKEEKNKDQIKELKQAIRHLEIELDYEESRSGSYKYITSLEKQIEEKYQLLESLYENN